MAKIYELTESNVAERHTTSVHAGIVVDFLAQGTESMKITIEGMKPATLRAALRQALKGREAEGVKLAQGCEDTYLVRRIAE